jgi:Fe-S-cluster containining protein
MKFWKVAMTMFSAHKLDCSESALSPCKETWIEAMGKSLVVASFDLARKLVLSRKVSEANLCFECGLCCNGVIFADVGLKTAEVKALQSRLEGQLSRKNGEVKLVQPCAAFDGCRCRIYSERPTYCRQFECLLLKNVQEGRVERAAASGIVRTAKERAEKVRALLRELGDNDEGIALSLRFQRAAKRFENEHLAEDKAEIYGDLTLAVHDLNMLLSEAFYPG